MNKMIIKFNDLDEMMQKEYCLFLKKYLPIECEQIKAKLKSPLFAYGDSVLVDVDDNQISSVCDVITIEKDVFKVAYLTNYFGKYHIKELLLYLYQNYPTDINYKIGTNQPDLIKYLDQLGYHHYQTLHLSYDIKELKPLNYQLKEVDLSNIDSYIDVYKQSFYGIPHAASINKEEVLNDINHNTMKYYLVYEQDQLIGFFQYEKSKDNMIDIGLLPNHQNKGKGKLLLNDLQHYFKDQNKLNLIVVTTNIKAYHMYLKYGFKQEKVINTWYDL